MYHSILGHREQRISARDFQNAPHLVFNHYAADQKPDDYALGLWERFVPFTPRQVYDLFASDYEQEDVVVNLNAFESGKLLFEINEENQFLSRLEIRTGDAPAIIKSRIVVEPEAQGKGTGRNSMRNWMETTAAFGFSEFYFDASMHDGGNVWASMGAHLDRDKTRERFFEINEKILSQSLCARLAAVQPFISEEAFEKARSLCQLTRADDLVSLSSMNDIAVSREVMFDAPSLIAEFFEKHIADPAICARNVRKELGNLSLIFENEGRGDLNQVSLPAYLRRETSWPAVVDFSDDAQMEQVGHYVYGWRTLESVQEFSMA